MSLVRTPPGAIHSALASVIAASAAPYGFTISFWASGAVVMSYHGVPTLGEVIGFMAGALAAFCVLASVARSTVTGTVHDQAERVLAGMLHWIATGSAVFAAALIGRIDGWPAWPASSFAATSAYLVGASLQLAAVAAGRGRRAETDRRRGRLTGTQARQARRS